MKFFVTKHGLEWLSLSLSVYHLNDKVLQIAAYKIKYGMPINSIDLLTADIILGASGGLTQVPFPKSKLIFIASLWAIFSLTIILEMLRGRKSLEIILSTYCIVYCLYLLITISHVVIDLAINDSPDYYFTVLISRLVLFVLFAFLANSWVQKVRLRGG